MEIYMYEAYPCLFPDPPNQILPQKMPLGPFDLLLDYPCLHAPSPDPTPGQNP